MVNIDNEYIINANESCYTLERKSTVQDAESKNYGKETKIVEGYYTSIESALMGYMKAKTRKYISSENENCLKELLDEVKKMQKYLKEKFGEV